MTLTYWLESNAEFANDRSLPPLPIVIHVVSRDNGLTDQTVLKNAVLLLNNSECNRPVVPTSVLRASQRIRDQFPENPWIHFCNGYFEVDLLFYLKGLQFVKNSGGTTLIGDIFISYDR